MLVVTKLIKGWGVSYKKGKIFQILITERKNGNLKESILVGS